MNNTGALIFINNREALPVRAIPYYSAWRLSPDLLANEFSLGDVVLCNWLRTTPTYHMVNDAPVKILAPEWKNSYFALKSLAIRFKSEFKNDDQGYEAWCINSVAKLPAGAFVWLDDFLNSYSENIIELPDLSASKNNQEHQFTSHPIILKDSSIRKLVFEGIENYSLESCNNVDALEPVNALNESKIQWQTTAREIGISLRKQFPHQNQERIAEKVHKEMRSLHESNQPDVTGKGGRVPSAESIKRHALKGI